MKRRLLLLMPWFAAPLLCAAAPPAVTLLVELRWVDSQLPGAAQAGVRDGAVVIGTAGAVSPRWPGVVTSTRPAAPPPVQRLSVLNGQRAGLQLQTREPLRWETDLTVALDHGARAGTRQRVYASPRPVEHIVTQGFAVTPTWPGGEAPVRVAFEVDADGQQFQSVLDLPLQRWQTVARQGGADAPAPRGTVSSRDATGQPERELQLRLSVAPG
ncbi:hypothetical protein ACG02S_01255 [Roseateles sp. DC23W]|uniref:Uncharacterized protein n=1 Tax=Pelomonas dachongensis TaxID=3299029 RepID=A0ABW7EGM9_9BURK